MRIDSRDIDDLDPYVAANVRLFVSDMALDGFPVGISSTRRNDEDQAYKYAQGRTRPGPIITWSRVTTFHGRGLAFDIFQNIKGKEWNDPLFWAAADKRLAAMGFSRLSNEKCHAQWSDGGKFSGSQVRAGILPPPMPLYMPAQITPPPATLKFGNKGPDVVVLQTRLNMLKFPCGPADGDFGPRTREAVKAFQAARGLVVDAIVGKNTWKALMA